MLMESIKHTEMKAKQNIKLSLLKYKSFCDLFSKDIK